MATTRPNGVLRHFRRVTLLADGGGMTDGQLLDGFILRRDEAAFEALVRRHGPMVLGVCRRVLRHAHDAEDAFQATFLVLARKAATVTPRDLVGNWLYGVAYRAALEAKAARRTRERQVTEMPEPGAVEEAAVWSELRPLLDQELSRLPEKYRVAVVLCDLEGRTRRDAARQLGVAEGTLSGRLTTARRKLAERFTRRGLALSGGALAAVLSQGVASACLPASLVGSTTRAVAQVTAGSAATSVVSADVAALMEGVQKTMFLSKLKGVTPVLLACLALGGTVLMTFRTATAGQEAVDRNRPVAQARAKQADPDKPAVQAPGRGFTAVESDVLESVAFSHDNRMLASGGQGKAVLLWDMEKKTLGQTLKVPTQAIVRRVAFRPGGKTIAAGVDGAAIFLWNVHSGKLEAELQANLPSRPNSLGISGHVNSLRFLPGDKLLALYSYEPKDPKALNQGSRIVLWDLKNKKPETLHESGPSTLVDVAVSPDGKFLAASQFTSGLKVWDLDLRKVIWEETLGDKDFMSRVAFSPDGNLLAVGGGHTFMGPQGGFGAEGRLWLFDVKTRKQLWHVKEAANGAYNAVAFTVDSRGVLSGSSGKTVPLQKGGVRGERILSELRRWDAATGKEVWRADGYLGWVNSLTASADGKTIAVCDNGQLMLFDPQTGRLQQVLTKTLLGNPFADTLP